MKPRTTVEFLDALKARHGLSTDYKLAKFLHIRQQAISNYRIGKQHFGDEVAIMIAAQLDLDPGYVLACIHEERTKRPQVKAAWRQVARALASGENSLLTSSPSDTPDLTRNIHYTKYRRRPPRPPRIASERRSPRGRPRTTPRQFLLIRPERRLHA